MLEIIKMLDFIFTWLPSQTFFNWLKKKIYHENNFIEDIAIDTRSSNAIRFSLNSEVPTIQIWLVVRNKSQYLDAIFDRAILTIWIKSKSGYQVYIPKLNIITRKKIEKKREEEIFSEHIITEKLKESIKKLFEDVQVTVNLDIEYYIDSSLYTFSKRVHLENRHCEI